MIAGRVLGFVVLEDLGALMSTNEILSIIISVEDQTDICTFVSKSIHTSRIVLLKIL